MKPVRTPETNIVLTLPGAPVGERELPAARIFTYDSDLGETERDARAAFQTTWMPDQDEARRLEAGAAVVLTITGTGHPPVSLIVTDAVLPERELIQRGHVDRALGWLFGNLKVIDADDGQQFPDAETFADLWAEAVAATMERPDPEAEQQLDDAIEATRRQNGGAG